MWLIKNNSKYHDWAHKEDKTKSNGDFCTVIFKTKALVYMGY